MEGTGEWIFVKEEKKDVLPASRPRVASDLRFSLCLQIHIMHRDARIPSETDRGPVREKAHDERKGKRGERQTQREHI